MRKDFAKNYRVTHWLICAQVCVRGLALGLLLLHEEPRREEDVVGVPVLAALLRHRAVLDHGDRPDLYTPFLIMVIVLIFI